MRMGSAQVRAAQGIGTSRIRQTQRSPLVLTQWLRLERTGSREMPLAAMRLPGS